MAQTDGPKLPRRKPAVALSPGNDSRAGCYAGGHEERTYDGWGNDGEHRKPCEDKVRNEMFFTLREIVMSMSCFLLLLATAAAMAYAYHKERTAALEHEALYYASQLLEAQREDCRVRMRLGDAYAQTLTKMLDGLGLINDAWKTPSGMILKAYYGLEDYQEVINIATGQSVSKSAIGGPGR